jgi:PAS domain S-box-containing protein
MKAAVRGETTLARQAQAARQRLEDLYRRAGVSSPDPGLVNEALEELSIALEELQVSVEEMRASNEQLAASRQELEAQRRHYLELFDFAPDGYLVTDMLGTIHEANRVAAKLLRVRQNFLVGKPIIVFIPQAQHQPFRKLLDGLKNEEKIRTWEAEMQPRRGPSFPTSLAVSRIVDVSTRGARPIGLRWLLRDISERKQSEQALRESETRLAGVMDNSPSMIFLKDVEGRYLYVNPEFEKLTHQAGSKLLGKTDFEIFAHEPAATFRRNDLKVLQSGEPLQFEEVALHGDGPHTSLVTKFPLFDAVGNINATCGIATDITERKKAEELLRQSEQFNQSLFEYAPDAIVVLDQAGLMAHLNAPVETMFGYSRQELLGNSIEMLIPERFRNSHAKHRRGYMTEPRIRSMGVGLDLRGRRKDGSEFPVDIMLSPLGGDKVIAIVRDITDRKRAEEQILTDLQRITTLHDINSVISSTLDLQEVLSVLLHRIEVSFPYPIATTVRLLNRENKKLEKLCCRNIDLTEWHAAQSPSSDGRAQQVIESKVPLIVRNVQTDSRSMVPDFYVRNSLVSCLAIPLIIKQEVNGILCLYTREEHEFSDEEIDFLSSVAIQAAIAIYNSQLYEQSQAQAVDLQKAHDNLELRVQERTQELAEANEALRAGMAVRQRVEQKLRDVTKKLEEKLIVSDRLISFGELAASIAHEFNNPLQIILGFTQDMIDDRTASQSHQHSLKIVVQETVRCKEIIKSLLDLARPSTADLVLAAVEYTIDDSLKVCLPYLEKSKVKVETVIPPGLPHIYADPQQLRQVIINLCFNAAEAMPNGGVLTIRAVTSSRQELPADRKEGSGGRELIIAVTDTGTGIDAETKANIFRPFYSTKKSKGMGLGLFICERIMETHKGRISVESAPGSGATFYLHFPLGEV